MKTQISNEKNVEETKEDGKAYLNTHICRYSQFCGQTMCEHANPQANHSGCFESVKSGKYAEITLKVTIAGLSKVNVEIASSLQVTEKGEKQRYEASTAAQISKAQEESKVNQAIKEAQERTVQVFKEGKDAICSSISNLNTALIQKDAGTYPNAV